MTRAPRPTALIPSRLLLALFLCLSALTLFGTGVTGAQSAPAESSAAAAPAPAAPLPAPLTHATGDLNSATAVPQHREAAIHGFWNFTGPGNDLWNVDQTLWIEQKAHHTYWALNWTFTGFRDGGYMGLQTDGIRFDGSVGETAIFSLWNANATSGPSCGTFAGEGVGLSCRMPFTIQQDRQYRLRVWILGADAGGQWWGGWVSDGVTDHHIGSIRVPADHNRMTGVMNFTEYFGPAVPCDQVPQSVVHLTQPAANKGADRYGAYSTYTRANTLTCTNGWGVPEDHGWTKGVRLVLGDRIDRIASPDGRFVLLMQSDGHLVQYEIRAGRPMWYTNTFVPGTVLRLQPDGNLVLYAPGRGAIWHTNTHGNPGAFLRLQDDGNLVLYSASGRPLWWNSAR